ncbi:DUF4279 domain-containing protein [Microbacterium sp. ZW T5_45]|uniref:DUF4279 domain-containing protein n=1 Tax=Microbacterium sp. ZW T5_45 TaxID=3378080 RepID=UPI0038523A0B
MIQSGIASFVVLSTDTEPEAVSELLGLVPTSIRRRGEVSRTGWVREVHVWSLDVNRIDNSHIASPRSAWTCSPTSTWATARTSCDVQAGC